MFIADLVHKTTFFVHQTMNSIPQLKRQMPGANFPCDIERRALSLSDSLSKENNAVDHFLFSHRHLLFFKDLDRIAFG